MSVILAGSSQFVLKFHYIRLFLLFSVMRGISEGVLMVTGIILIVEILAYLGIIQLVRGKLWKRRVSVLYWSATMVLITFWLIAFLDPEKIRRTIDYRFFYFIIFTWTLNFVPKALWSVFFIFSLPFRLLKNKICSEVILLSGLVLGTGVMFTLGLGILAGKKVIRTEEIELKIPALPEGLNGLKVVQLSDLHLGGMGNDRFLRRCVNRINSMEPDLILFTGDMVNNYHQEIDGFKGQLKALRARYGKFAVLGNHDYGDYTNWDSPADKERNFSLILEKIRDSGFRLLLNQSSQVRVGDTCLYIVGVENWGHPPFPQYARLDSALKDVPAKSFRILMTHDPAHWSDQIRGKTDIPFTLSGHTHGGQTGLKIAGMEFSPIWLTENRWGGLYKENGQFLYVNRGIGCVGLPARIDMPPEITVFTLSQK